MCWREALRQYILSELRLVGLEAKLIMTRYGILCVEELDEKVGRGELEETKVFEDLTRLDYLLDREEKLKKLLEELRRHKKVSKCDNIDEILEGLRELAISLYPEIVVNAEIVYGKLRIYIVDRSFLPSLPEAILLSW